MIGPKKEQELKRMPRIESRIFRSKNGRFIIQKTVISSIRPVEYYQKVLEAKEMVSMEDFDDSDFFYQDGAQVAES